MQTWCAFRSGLMVKWRTETRCIGACFRFCKSGPPQLRALTRRMGRRLGTQRSGTEDRTEDRSDKGSDKGFSAGPGFGLGP